MSMTTETEQFIGYGATKRINGETIFTHAKNMECERNEARKEAERWRDAFKTGMSMQLKSPSKIFPWEESP
jgi:hypothetical protein